MPAERAGYTVTMFLVDISPSMGKMRQVELPGAKPDQPDTIEMSNLGWSLQYVRLKIQEMIFNGRKTDQCGVILFGTEDTDNLINKKNGGYEHVAEYIPIAQPNSGTLEKLAKLEPSTVAGDPIDALIVGVETQHQYLSNKKTWTRKIVLLTDGENPIEIEDWEATVRKMNSLKIYLIIVGVDFDDDDLPFHEEGKSTIKRENETFYHKLVEGLEEGIVGNCEFVLSEISRPDVKQVKSTLMGTVLRIGDVDARPEQAIELIVKTSKCTALARPKGFKKFSRREKRDSEEDLSIVNDDEHIVYAQLKMRTEYYIEDERLDGDDDDGGSDQEEDDLKRRGAEKVEKEQLVRGFKYGTSYAPCPDGGFPRLPTCKGIDICGFFKDVLFRREWSMSEVSYIWGDPAQPLQQVALSAIVQAMYKKGAYAIARWVSKDGMDPKMGVLAPAVANDVDCLLWVQMPFADDIRNFSFGSLDNLVSKKGETIKEHPYLPTQEQQNVMDQFVDAMDLSDAGEKDEDGNRLPWFDTRLSYNPAIHRVKQAQFHAAVVQDLDAYPLPPPHLELTKYFEPPRRALKRAREAVEECKGLFRVREVPKKVARTRKDGHVHAQDEDDETMLLDKLSRRAQTQNATQLASASQSGMSQQNPAVKKEKPDDSETESETEDEEEEELLLDRKHPPLPTPSPEDDSREADPGRAPGRIIGTTYPLRDFRDNILRGDVVSKAVEDLGAVIKEIVLKPFTSRRTDELLECMRELRKTALEEDEIDAWNTFLRDFRTACLDEKPGNTSFWSRVRELGRDISLISKFEAGKLGGKSDTSESEAAEW